MFYGDGAVRQGAFHEALNLAMLWNLPVIFIIENNGYAMGTSVERTANHSELWKLGLGYEMPCCPVSGMDPVAMFEKVSKAVARARSGDGPTLLEAKTYRYKGHSMSDAQHYRTKDEVAEYQKIDPITTVLEVIKNKKYASEKEIEDINQEVKKIVAEAVQLAEESPFPTEQDLYDSVYEQADYPFIKIKKMAEVVSMPRLSDTMTEGVVAKWHKKVGDPVSEGDLLAEIGTNKATMEFESFQEGVLLHIGIEEGGKAPVDSILAILGEEGENVEALINEYDKKNEAEEESPVKQKEEVKKDIPKKAPPSAPKTTEKKVETSTVSTFVDGGTKTSPLLKN